MLQCAKILKVQHYEGIQKVWRLMLLKWATLPEGEKHPFHALKVCLNESFGHSDADDGISDMLE